MHSTTGVDTLSRLKNGTVTSNAGAQDGDEYSNLGAGVGLQDGLDGVWTDVEATSVDGDERNNFGIKFSFDE